VKVTENGHDTGAKSFFVTSTSGQTPSVIIASLRSRRSRLNPRAAVVLALFFAPSLFAQVSERIDVSAIEVPVVVRDAKGNVPAGLTLADFVLLEDGKPQQIIGVAYPVQTIATESASPSSPVAPTAAAPARRWQVVIFIQQSLSTTRGLSGALKDLASHAGELVALGDVQIVGDEGSTPRVIAPATGNADTLRNTLLDLAPKIRGQELITKLRADFVADEQADAGNRPPPSTPDGQRNTGQSLRAAASARFEAQIVRARQDAMLTWTSRYQEPGRPHALLVVTDGYDLEPLDFYARPDGERDTELRGLGSAAHQAEVAQALAAGGWTILSFAPGWMNNAGSPTFDVTNAGRGRLNDFVKSPKGGIASPNALNIRPLDPLRTLAEETGGSVQTSGAKLGIDLDQLANRVVITYQLHRPRDGRAHHIEVKSLRPGMSVHAQRSVISGTPEALAVARATMLAGSDQEERGELPVQCTVRQIAASKNGNDITSELAAFVTLTPIDAVRSGLTAATLRFSIAVRSAGAPPVTIAKRMENLDLSKQASWRIDFQVHHEPGAAIGVVAEEMATGAWGGTSCSSAEAPAAAAESRLSLPQSGKWKTLPDALAAAQASGSLVLLDLLPTVEDQTNLRRTRGIKVRKQEDEWLAAAGKNPATARAMEGMVLAAADASALSGYPNLRQIYAARRQLIVLDPWGGIVAVPSAAFADQALFAGALNALRQQTPIFVRAAKAFHEGKIGPALVLRAGALLDAGAVDAAKEGFRLGYATAQKSNDIETMQRAQIGLAAIDLPAQKAVRSLEEITAHPATSEIAARAWMLLAHTYRQNRATKQAIEAYQKSFTLAPKPSTLAEAARRHLETLGSEPESETLAGVAAENVHLLYPHREMMVGSVPFGVATSADAVRVDVYLDDARVAELTRQPFRVKVDLGTAPHVRVVRAVAFDAQERKLGEERVTLNDIAGALGVNIVAPAGDTVRSRTTVEATARIPAGVTLDGVDLYWNETKVATLTAAPFRHELVLPSPSASGFIRVVARASDGTTAEDVKMINAGGAAEQVRVDAVQVYAIVQDRSGHYVDGLKASDFVVKEDGRTVTPQLQSGSDDPISIGIALDTSASMHVVMNEVMDYANEFVEHSLGAADRTFVTAFDAEPHLVQPLTNNRKQLTNAIYDLHAAGVTTAIWDAVLYSLEQFRGVSGKRALVVFTDGINNAGTASLKDDLKYAREVGVPVYFVQIYTGVRGFDDDGINNLTESTGGAYFRFAGKRDLPRIFSQVRDDTRGQYLLTYVSPGTAQRGNLRRISVEVPGKNVLVRATSGYYPR
jgi:Ca-activated chloride channel family protein